MTKAKGKVLPRVMSKNVCFLFSDSHTFPSNLNTVNCSQIVRCTGLTENSTKDHER